MEHSVATLERPVAEPEASPVHPEEQPGWNARPGVALALRAAIFLAPIVASVLASFLVARSWPRPNGLLPALGWLGVLFAVGALAMIAIDRVARRFLPLTALLRMTLIFPDQAPSRFNIALRTGTTKQLEHRLEQVRAHGLGETEAEAAETLLHLAAALREHDRFTRGHGERVRAYTALIGEELDLSPSEISKLQWAGLIHDIGKLAVPEEVLNKPGRLTAEEYELIKTHPAEGMAMMGPLTGWLGEWALAVGEHHERWDGGGYPAGLAGTDISLAGRIVAVADTFDVITATRSYKPAQSPQWARRELASNAGTQFDPEVVRAFLNISLGKLRGVMWPLSWIAHIPFIGSAVAAPSSGIAVATAAVVSSSLTGGGLAGAMPVDETYPVANRPIIAAEAPESTSPAITAPIVVIMPPKTSSTIVARLADQTNETTTTTDDPAVEGGAPVVIVVTSLPFENRSSDVGGFAESATGPAPIVVTPPVTRVVPVSGGTSGTTSPVAPGTTTPKATVITIAPSTTVAPSNNPAPTTTVAPTTTTVAATACQQAKSGATNLAGADLTSCNLSGVVFDGVDLTGANLNRANLSGAQISNFTMNNANLTRTNLDGAVLTNGSMILVSSTGMTATGVTLKSVDVSGSTLVGVDFSDGVFVDVSFESINANGVEFPRARFDRVSFANSRIMEADFDEAVFVSVTMNGAMARAASFAAADLRGTDFTNADLREADFSVANMTNAQLAGARIGLAALEATNLRGATGIPSGAASAEYDATICPSGAVQSSNCWP